MGRRRAKLTRSCRLNSFLFPVLVLILIVCRFFLVQVLQF